MRFRRREPLHERLAREGGLAPREPIDTRPQWGEVGIHGVARPRAWDAVVTAAADLDAAEAGFVALPDGTVVVESGPDDPGPLVEALEGSLAPPYRAEAIRRDDGRWAVAARTIRVVDLPLQTGDELELTVTQDERRLVVDGEPRLGSVPALEELVRPAGHVRASRIDGTLWEVDAALL